MRIAITGGTGFIGKKLVQALLDEGHSVYVLTRSDRSSDSQENLHYVQWLQNHSYPEKELEGIDAFYHLAGESIGAKRWTEEQKEKILESRLSTTNEVIRILTELEKKPSALICASAIGYYGHSDHEVFTEESTPSQENFLTTVVKQWEEATQRAEELGIRVVSCRLGIVLHPEEGALKKILLPIRFFIGGPLGKGTQWMSWIHVEDVIRLFVFVLKDQTISGPINFTAPEPVKMKTFGKEIAQILNRPFWLPAPSFALKIALGEMRTLVLDGQKVMANKAFSSDFSYKYTTVREALNDLLTKQ
ncbi:multidrug MFS transporter [Bacillus sp. TS-2]|nr:multidrug MFS transporter [Bacillus sp. TS-2]